jgi:hypothetical protein
VSIVSVAAVPAAPLLLPAASPAQPAALADEVAALRAEVDATLRELAGAGVVVLLAAGEEGVLHDRAVASLRPLGVDGPDRELPVDTDLLAAVAGRGRFPRGRTDRLDGDVAVLTLLCAEAGRTGPILPLEVPATALGGALDAVAAGLRSAAETVERDVAVVAAGDLSAGLDTASPAYAIPGADEFDRRMVAALRGADHDALMGLGPSEAGRVRARGWAGLVVADTLAGREPARRRVRYSSVRGVGQVVLRA